MNVSRSALVAAFLATLAVPRLLQAQQSTGRRLCRDSTIVPAAAGQQNPCANHGGPLLPASADSIAGTARDSSASAAHRDTTRPVADQAGRKRRSEPVRTARDAWARDTVKCADGSAPNRQGVCETKKVTEYMKRP